jgi:hypothetical protein
MVGMRNTSSTLLLLAACVTPKAIGQTPDTDSDTDVDPTEVGSASSSGDDSGDPTGEPIMCPDNPGMCADVDHNFCEQDPGGLDSLFDDDCCPRPRCDGGGSCPDGRVCIGVGPYGGGGPSSLFCGLDETNACGCGATADGAVDVRVCVPEQDVTQDVPSLCTLEEVVPAFTITDPLPETVDALWTCDVTAADADGFSLACTAGELIGAPSFAFADDVELPLAVDDEVVVDFRSDDSGGRPQVWVRIDGENGPQIVLGMGETLTYPSENPPWPAGVAPLEAVDAGCPTFACDGEGPSWTGRLLRAGSDDYSVVVGPGEALVLDTAPESPGAVLHVYEAHVGNCGVHAGQPAFYSYALIQLPI